MPAPTLSSATLNAAASQLTTVWSASSVASGVAVPTVRVAARDASIACTYLSGSPSTSIVWTLSTTGAVYADDTVVVDAPADTVQDVIGDLPNAATTGAAVTNNSALQRQKDRFFARRARSDRPFMTR